MYLNVSSISSISSMSAKRHLGTIIWQKIKFQIHRCLPLLTSCFSFVTLLPRCHLETFPTGFPEYFLGFCFFFFSETCWPFSTDFRESDKSGMLLLQWIKTYPNKCCCTESCFCVRSPGKMGKHLYCHNGVTLFPL